jgi:hypothetical protein
VEEALADVREATERRGLVRPDVVEDLSVGVGLSDEVVRRVRISLSMEMP